MNDGEIDDTLERAARAPHEVDPALLDRIAASVRSSLRPVRPLPPAWVLSGGLVSICAAVALAGAARSGFYGFHKMSFGERALIFPALALFICLAATACVSQMIPGSRRRISPGALLAGGSLALLAVFAVLFHDYHTERFVTQGVVCLSAGLLHAVAAALVSRLLLRRGFAVNAVTAGLVTGIFAGLAGVTMLELHCPNFEAPHVMLWHTAVIPVSAAAGALLGRFRRSRVLL